MGTIKVVTKATAAKPLPKGPFTDSSPENMNAAMAVAGITRQLIPFSTFVFPGVYGTLTASFARVMAPAAMMIPAALAMLDQAPGSLKGSFGTT